MARRRPSIPRLPPAGGETISRPDPKVTTPSRLPRRAAKRPTTSAAPSATSALRRSAVPKCIDGEWSSRSQAVSCRSGTSSRTCGTSVRAVAFQSILRTSSPGSYGRMRSSSRPAPWPRPRWSPVIWPPTRRSSDSSSCRTSRSAIGPGPGRAGRPVAPADAGEVGARTLRAGDRHAVGSTAISRRGAGTRVEDPLDDGVGGDPVGQRGVAQDQPVAQDVGRQGDDVGRQDVAAAVEEGHRAGAVDEVDRAARAGAVRDVGLEVGGAPVGQLAGRLDERDRVADEPRVDVDLGHGPLEAEQARRRRGSRAAARPATSERATICASSAGFG